jgi:hypothetical protein
MLTGFSSFISSTGLEMWKLSQKTTSVGEFSWEKPKELLPIINNKERREVIFFIVFLVLEPLI